MSAIQNPFSLISRSLPARWRANLRAMLAVTRKEWTITRRYPSWIIAVFIWPIIFPAMYILSARALAGPDGAGQAQFLLAAGTDNFLGYIIIGSTVWMWQNIVLWDVGYALRNEQMRGTLEANWMTPTARFLFLVGGSLSQFTIALVFILVTLFEFVVFFGLRLNGSPWLGLLALVFSIPSIYGLGFAFASLVIAVKEANGFVFLVRGMVMIFCGISYPISVMPGWMQSVASFMPQTYSMRAMRSALLAPTSLQELLPDLGILALFGLFWMAFGYLIFTLMDRRARRSGAIAQY